MIVLVVIITYSYHVCIILVCIYIQSIIYPSSFILFPLIMCITNCFMIKETVETSLAAGSPSPRVGWHHPNAPMAKQQFHYGKTWKNHPAQAYNFYWTIVNLSAISRLGCWVFMVVKPVGKFHTLRSYRCCRGPGRRPWIVWVVGYHTPSPWEVFPRSPPVESVFFCLLEEKTMISKNMRPRQTLLVSLKLTWLRTWKWMVGMCFVRF